MYVKPANSENNTDNHSRKRGMSAKGSWMYYIHMYGDRHRYPHSADADIMSHSSTIFRGIAGSTLCGKRVKCSDTSKGLKTKSKKPQVGMFDAFDRMEVRSISQMTLRHTFERKEFNENSLAVTHRNRTV